MDDVFKALADATRRELLDRLRAGNGQTLSELCDRMAMSRQAVSKHLAILEGANLVALAIMLWIGWRGGLGKTSGAFKAIGMYWHFVDVVWIAVFSIVYLRNVL